MKAEILVVSIQFNSDTAVYTHIVINGCISCPHRLISIVENGYEYLYGAESTSF
jgi:hypothetical protein